MATNFPTSLDSLSNPSGTDVTGLTTGQSNVTHSQQHTNANDAIEALQAKVGADSSAVTSSLDYKVTNASSSNPGHKHTLAQGATDVTASADELNYSVGVTSAIQTQLNAKTRAFSKVVAPNGITTEADYYCDGTDDDVQIQAAINAVATAGGGVVFLRAGTYVLGGLLTVTNQADVSIVGEGKGITIIQAEQDLVTGVIITVSGTSTNFRISNLTIDGNSSVQTTTEHSGINIIANSAFIENVEIKNLKDLTFYGLGVYLDGDYSIVSNASFSGCESGGLYIDSNSNYCLIENSISTNSGIGFFIDGYGNLINGCSASSGTYGFYISSNQTSVTNCFSEDNSNVGFYNDALGVSFSSCVSLTDDYGFSITSSTCSVSDCISYNSLDIGFNISSIKNSISGSVCSGAANAGFYVSGETNSLSGCVANGNGGTGFDIVGGKCSLSGCVATSNTTGIVLFTAGGNSITGCEIANNTGHGINCDSGNNVISGNSISVASGLSADTTYSGIIIGATATVTRNVITGNRINGDGATNDYAYGIREQAAADDYNLVVGNIVTGADTAQISLQGSNSVSANNIEA